MKRSEVNRAILWARQVLDKYNIRLPDMAYWDMDEWARRDGELDTVRSVMLGWDITDFGLGRFDALGAVLYTVRNGSLADPDVGVPYCEKYIIMRGGQRLTKHYHVWKTEDIIHRAGDGPLQICLWNTDPDGHQLDTDVQVMMDGIARTVKPGEALLIHQGNSISLAPHIAHIFGPAPGARELVIGEVSKVNDDRADNYFLEPTARFADIEEDEPRAAPLCNEYGKG